MLFSGDLKVFTERHELMKAHGLSLFVEVIKHFVFGLFAV